VVFLQSQYENRRAIIIKGDHPRWRLVLGRTSKGAPMRLMAAGLLVRPPRLSSYGKWDQLGFTAT
jgi:hypothetical protein